MTQSTDIEDLQLYIKKSRFVPIIDVEKLERMVVVMIKHNAQTRDDLEKNIRHLRRKYKASPSNSQLFTTYITMCNRGDFTFDSRYQAFLQSNQCRSNSGVNVVAVTIKTFIIRSS